jgi:hypothetical protein
MKRRVTIIFVALMLFIFSGCGKTEKQNITKIDSVSLSISAELTDYYIQDDTFYATICLDDVESLEYLVKDASLLELRDRFLPTIEFEDGSTAKLSFMGTGVKQLNGKTEGEWTLEGWIPTEEQKDTLSFTIHLEEFDSDFELYELEASA